MQIYKKLNLKPELMMHFSYKNIHFLHKIYK